MRTPSKPAAAPDLRALARQTVTAAGFRVHLPPDAQAQLAALDTVLVDRAGDDEVRDLRDLLWISIDSPEARDLDQVSTAEALPGGGTRMLVGIADVDASVPRHSALDRHAAANTTSIYAGIETFHMLPEQLATGRTSLLEGEDRLGLVVEFVVDGDGALHAGTVYRALIRNRVRLDYDAAGAWLEGDAAALPQVSEVAGLAEQIRLQDTALRAARARRERTGTMDIVRAEVQPVFEDGRVVDIVVVRPNRARSLIEHLMVATNSVAGAFLRTRQIPWIARAQIPQDWQGIVELAAAYGEALPAAPDAGALARFLQQERAIDPRRGADLQTAAARLIGAGGFYVIPPGVDDPGHFSLGLDHYTRATAPNRRYIDLVTQRLLKAAIADRPSPYTVGELEAIVTRCQERGRAAGRVERDMLKLYAIILLQDRVGEVFDAVVTNAGDRGVWARLSHPPVEGRIIRGEEGLVAGDRVQVRLTGANWQRGFIDLVHAP